MSLESVRAARLKAACLLSALSVSVLLLTTGAATLALPTAGARVWAGAVESPSPVAKNDHHQAAPASKRRQLSILDNYDHADRLVEQHDDRDRQ